MHVLSIMLFSKEDGYGALISKTDMPEDTILSHLLKADVCRSLL
jgi:hypothetical protein